MVVDAENVRRSCWPNLSREELVERTREWAAREGHELLVVFDGAPPEASPDIVGSHNADDAIVELAEDLEPTWWLVTSDRGLRDGSARAGAGRGWRFVRPTIQSARGDRP